MSDGANKIISEAQEKYESERQLRIAVQGAQLTELQDILRHRAVMERISQENLARCNVMDEKCIVQNERLVVAQEQQAHALTRIANLMEGKHP